MNDIDKKYLDAIKNNNLEEADEIIKQVAYNNGYKTKAYHGTNANFNVFKAQIGKAIWFTEDKTLIERGEVGASGKGKIISVYLRTENPAGWNEYEKLGEGQIINMGFDSVKLDDSWIVYNPNQIKLADTIVKNNFGQIILPSKRFNANKNDIRENIKTFKEFLCEAIDLVYNPWFYDHAVRVLEDDLVEQEYEKLYPIEGEKFNREK
ncbi:hypothetical protein EOM09_08735, partial [bacterium]|nr:hypothetical protein [bacterium]